MDHLGRMLHGRDRSRHRIAFLESIATIVAREIFHILLTKLWLLEVEDLCLRVPVPSVHNRLGHDSLEVD